MLEDGEEIPPLGGNVTEGLVRVGGTVRRPPGERDELVRDVLLHLERAGFEGAPRFLGVDSARPAALGRLTNRIAVCSARRGGGPAARQQPHRAE
ncbi:hypothetical protein [Kribbella solani]|uniref:hypothetical protein n=1 Tax=Kribbella solani TaxID=236067 RepID=UPI0029AB80A7|nr:hypothetical protein [Kribbella solani]MDX2972995.1 hypothetical protein [Kribbella solani]